MRDYKFRQTEWTRPKPRRKTLRVVAVTLALVALGLLVFAALQWRATTSSTSEEAAPPRDSLVIPLAIPSAGSAQDTAAEIKPPVQTEPTAASRQN